MRFMAYQIDIANLSDARLIQWLFEVAFTIGCIQGAILLTQLRKFIAISWIFITSIGGVLAFAIGQFIFFFLMFTYVPASTGFLIGGVLLGFVHSLILRKFPRAFVIIPTTAAAYFISWSMLSAIFIQASDSYTSAPANADFIYTTTKSGILLGTIQGAGLLCVLSRPSKIQGDAD